MGRRLLDAMPLAEAVRILDVGTGTGALLPDIRAVAPHAYVAGIDRAEGMLRVARAVSNFPLAVMDAHALAIRPACIDAAVLIFVLFLVPEPQRALDEVARVLKPGGVVGIATWGQTGAYRASEVWMEEMKAHGAPPDPAQAILHHDLMNTPEKIQGLLEQRGFVSTRAWTERFVHSFDPEEFFALRTGCGSERRRLDEMDATARTAFLAHFRERLVTLKPEDFIDRPEVVFAIGQRSNLA